MKKLILLFALSLGLGSASAIAHEFPEDNHPVAYPPDRQEWLARHVDHLQRMVDHVRWQLRQYRTRADWGTRREVEDISHDVNRVRAKFRTGDYNRARLRSQVERLHDRLHAVEERLQVRSRDYYRWD
jgi:hypothetical protein